MRQTRWRPLSGVTAVLGLILVFPVVGCGSSSPTPGVVVLRDASDGAGGGDAARTDQGGAPGLDVLVEARACETDEQCKGAFAARPDCRIERCTDGACVLAVADDGTPCAQGDGCRRDGACGGGECLATPVDCDDGNDCTEDGCAAELGCFYRAVEGACDDRKPWTTGDRCEAGRCVGETGPCACESDPDCAAGDDGDRCNGIFQCVDGQCAFAPQSVVDCGAASAPCRRKVCEPGTGTCREIDRDAGDPCDDGDACTSGEICGVGACGGGAPVVCDDGNPCTFDRCDVWFGCLTVPAALDCDDGDPCTTADRCVDGACQGGIAVDCDDRNPCTADRCEPALGGCVHAPADAPCSDGNPCSDGDTCVDGRCVAGTADVCGTCSSDAECLAYDDRNLCNGIVRCREGVCRIDPLTVVTCPAPLSPCRVAVCLSATGVCQEQQRPNGTPCDDGNVCTEAGACADGVCVTRATACDDDNPCTQDGCTPGTGCSHVPTEGACDDGNRCTRNDRCAGGRCQPGATDDCGACTTDIDCAPGDDLNRCNGSTQCNGGRCVLAADSLVTCPVAAPDACTASVCDPATGLCATEPLAEGAVCDDGDACTAGDQCTPAGTCDGAPRTCDDGNGCTSDSCDELLGCRFEPNAAACDDVNLCTTGDTCVGGRCSGGAPTVCDDDDPCTTDACDPFTGECSFVENTAPCDDGSACTVNDTCGAGECVGRTIGCEDGNPCTEDVCDPAVGCTHRPYDADDCEGGPCECDDSEPCTIGDVCADGVCRSGVVACGEYCANGRDDEPDGLTDCADPDCASLPTCQGEGACEPVGDVGCLETVSGTLGGEGSTNQVDSYPSGACVGADYAGPELAWRFVPDCDGVGHARLRVSAASNPTRPRIDVFVLRANDLGQCVAATGCISKGIITWIGQTGTAEALFVAEAGETYFLVADGQLGAVGDFSLEAICYCD